ncbi:MAG TPA: tRNA 2-thiouridine(34) synthase MnmA [Dehalococcoidia bacterium]|nr:tRNA 2-thiouridine(34) synthase MnmA [Dehalococcoidia bacterium]
MAKPRVIVAMSGGVDSSVAAALLLQQGHEVIGVTMRLWTEEDYSAPRFHRQCCSVEDTADARAACDALGIPHYVLNFEREFASGVVDYFVEEYSRGRTPNPCLACNDKVKFRPLLDYAMALGANYLATGHYARIRRERESFQLWKALDPHKDQSYVLYTLGQDELSRTLFPVGEFSKDKIRRIAHEHALPNADKPDSADICFIPGGNYRAFVRQRVSAQPGRIIDTAGKEVGVHQGVVDFTIGQRRGLPARGGSPPYFVVDIDPESNTVVVGEFEELRSSSVLVEGLNFISGETPVGDIEVEARVRYRTQAAPAVLRVGDGVGEVRFLEPQRAVTPGQAIVFYQGERVLGGGTIARRFAGRNSQERMALGEVGGH